MPSFCVVSSCEYKYNHAENVSFHKFPTHSPAILQKWMEFTDRGPHWRPSRWSAICSRHFLPSDFRNLLQRKCLKKNAVPSITQFTGNFLEFDEDEFGMKIDYEEHDEQVQVSIECQFNAFCRLCGFQCKSAEAFTNNFEVFGLIQKCFPTLNIHQDDDLSKHVCPACLDRLHLFSIFIDDVIETQKELEVRRTQDKHNDQPTSKQPLIIKQEPVIKVKQEVNEIIQRSTKSEKYENDTNKEQDEYEHKSQLHNNLAMINSAEIIKNCDIMEIITLDDAFIDILDDEAGEEELSPSDSAKIQSFPNSTDHNYAAPNSGNEISSHYQSCKTEMNEERVPSTIVSTSPSATTTTTSNIVVIDGSILKSSSAISGFQCDMCPIVFFNESTLIEHKNLYHLPVMRKCDGCNREFDTFFKLLKHKNKFHKDLKTNLMKKKTNVKCPMCDKVFTSKLALNNHRKYICEHQYHKGYECKYCARMLSKWVLLRQHEKACKESTRRLKANENQVHQQQSALVAPTFASLTSSIMPGSHPNPNEKGHFECPICGRTYTRRRNLFKHQTMHRPPSLWNHKCGDCNKLFDHIYDLRRHLRTEECSRDAKISIDNDATSHGNNRVSDDENDPKSSQKLFFVCTVCGKKLLTLQRLKQHCITHSGKKPFVCESCGKSFASIHNLYQHHVTHTDVRRYKCDLCEKVFKRRSGLSQHTRAYHLKIKPHECPICKHRYALKGDMIRCKHSFLRH